MSVVVTSSVCQPNTWRDQWTAHWRLVGLFSWGHKVLTVARRAHSALHSSHTVLPPIVSLLTTMEQAVQSISAPS